MRILLSEVWHIFKVSIIFRPSLIFPGKNNIVFFCGFIWIITYRSRYQEICLNGQFKVFALLQISGMVWLHMAQCASSRSEALYSLESKASCFSTSASLTLTEQTAYFKSSMSLNSQLIPLLRNSSLTPTLVWTCITTQEFPEPHGNWKWN